MKETFLAGLRAGLDEDELSEISRESLKDAIQETQQTVEGVEGANVGGSIS
jgi:hypothetical protein